MRSDPHPPGGDSHGVAARRDLPAIFAAAVAAVDPRALVRGYLAAHPPTAAPLVVVGAGKAAARMAAGVEDSVSPDRLSGLVVTAPGCEVSLGSIRTVSGSHPLPDAASLAATEELWRTVREAAEESQVLALVSGGASSLLVRPRPPLTLADKLETNRLLLACGAAVGELNTVRKHLSLVKGGGLLRLAGRRRVTTLILSDVPGDDPSVIGSAPTVADPTTYADALAVLRRYDLLPRVPAAVRALLEAGERGEVEETRKPSAAVAGPVVVIGDNALARRAAAAEATARGYEPLVDERTLIGDTRVAAQAWARGVAALPRDRRCCAIAGGETTVVVRGSGRGGRNQEFALVAATELAGHSVALLSAGTDGIDGPTDAAGAYADGSTLERARRLGLDPERALADNDTYPFFDRLGDLLRTGPTGTNVMDLKIAVLPSGGVPPPEQR